ncbi:MAG: MFS transporter [Gemmatimonadota bacterium]
MFNDFASEMVYPLLPGFITRTLGGSATILGMLDGAADLAASLVKLVSGRLSDRPGWRKPLILGGYLSAILIRPLMALSSAAWQVVGFRVVDRIGKGARTPPRDALIADITPPEVAGRAFGFHRGADHLGAVLGSLAAWWLLRHAVPIRQVLTWSVLPGIVAFLVLAVVLKGTREGTHSAPLKMNSESEPHPVFWPPVLVLAALTFFRLPEALLLLRLQDLGMPLPTIPLMWAGLHVVRTAASYPGGKLVDSFGPRMAVAIGGVLFSLVAVALGLPLTITGAIVVFLVFGLVAGLSESGEMVLVSRLSPRRGRGFGAYHGTLGIAALPAGILYGWLYQHVGGPNALWVSAGVVLLTVVAWLTLRLDSAP